MNVDFGSILQAATSAICTVAAPFYCAYRELKGMIAANTRNIDSHGRELGDFKTEVAKTYAPRSEMTDTVAALKQDLKQEIRNNTQDLKDFIDAKMGNGK